jgi:hypothetical protein
MAVFDVLFDADIGLQAGHRKLIWLELKMDLWTSMSGPDCTWFCDAMEKVIWLQNVWIVLTLVAAPVEP